LAGGGEVEEEAWEVGRVEGRTEGDEVFEVGCEEPVEDGVWKRLFTSNFGLADPVAGADASLEFVDAETEADDACEGVGLPFA
jgi:hypothetical protein